MVRVKDAATRLRNYQSGAAVAPQRYKDAVQSTTGWKEAALAGQGLYEEKMRDAAVLRRRTTGLEKTSETDWKNKAVTVGATRIGTGMSAAADKQVRNSQPYVDGLASLELPARTADGYQNLVNRGGAVVKRMMEIKEQQG